MQRRRQWDTGSRPLKSDCAGRFSTSGPHCIPSYSSGPRSNLGPARYAFQWPARATGRVAARGSVDRFDLGPEAVADAALGDDVARLPGIDLDLAPQPQN